MSSILIENIYYLKIFMPQFDFYSFFVQIFWFSLACSIFYFIYLKFPLKNISQSLKLRLKIQKLASLIQLKPNFLYSSIIYFSQKN
jgi:hypothetical protein